MNPEKILIVDDTPANIRLLTEALESRGYQIFAASSGEQGIRVAMRAVPDLILLDVIMPERDGFAVCRALKELPATRDIPVLFVTAKQDTESLLKGFRAGAVDYIPKPFYAEEILIRVETHLKISRLTREIQMRNQQLEAEIARREAAEIAKRAASERLSALSAQEAARWGIAGFVGASRLIRKVLAEIERLQNFAGTNVLITGESGTGKELVARAIHYGSPRAHAPFVAVNGVAIPAELAESIFFGHLRGAFTGATSDRKGCFELADGGTLFLDEIGDMAPALQAKLLRVLEDREVTPVGASRPKKVDVRVVAATNADLERKIETGEFRQDLYFRLARYTVETPPLRERPEDIELLAAHFLAHFGAEMAMQETSLTPAALDVLREYSFPGNVRELKNVIERALIESGGAPIEPRHLRLIQRPSSSIAPASSSAPAARHTEDLPLNLEAAEQKLIQRALRETDGNVARAARLLGINRSRIYRRFL